LFAPSLRQNGLGRSSRITRSLTRRAFKIALQLVLPGCPGFWVELVPFGLPWQRNPPPTRRRLRCTQWRHRRPDYPIAIRNSSMPWSSRCNWLAFPD